MTVQGRRQFPVDLFCGNERWSVERNVDAVPFILRNQNHGKTLLIFNSSSRNVA
jgi:hypothetical protein